MLNTEDYREKELINNIISFAKDIITENEDIINYVVPELESKTSEFKFYENLPIDLIDNSVNLRYWGDDISLTKVKSNFLNKVTGLLLISHYQNYANHIFNSAIKSNVDIIIIKGGNDRLFPEIKCDTADFNYSAYDLIQDYGPSRIILYPLSNDVELYNHYMFGMYLLDDKDNFMCRQFIEIFHDDIAPVGCKSLRIPKTSTEFNQLFGLDY